MGIADLDLGDVSSTSLLTLYCHARESRSADPILRDPKAEEMMEAVLPRLAGSEVKLLRNIASGKVQSTLVAYIATRARHYDGHVARLVEGHPRAAIVNIGCGFDPRFSRVDNSALRFFDLDLPQVIEAKGQLLGETDRYRLIGRSALDHAWMDELPPADEGPFMFLAEGVFMYLDEQDVRALVVELARRFPGSELVCEVVNRRWTTGRWKRMADRKMQRRSGLGPEATYRFGVTDSDHMEAWAEGIELQGDWAYMDEEDRKIGAVRWFRRFELFRKVQWTVHYRLG